MGVVIELAGGNKMIYVDYEKLKVTGDWVASFKSKDEMEKAVKKYVFRVGQGMSRCIRKGVIEDNRPFIYKGVKYD